MLEGVLPPLPLSSMSLSASPAVTPRQGQGSARAPCRHKMNCHLRSRCKFFHPQEHQFFWLVLERYDPLAKTELCRHQLTNKRGCRMGPEACRFSHSALDSWCRRCGDVGHVQSECHVPAPTPSSLGDQPKPLKTAICRHWARGECTNVNCTFAHGEADAHCMKCQRTGHVTASCPRHLASRVGLGAG
jgi:ribosomal protein S27E